MRCPCFASSHFLLLVARLVQLTDKESPHQPEDKHKRREDGDNDYDDPDQEINETAIGIGDCTRGIGERLTRFPRGGCERGARR